MVECDQNEKEYDDDAVEYNQDESKYLENNDNSNNCENNSDEEGEEKVVSSHRTSSHPQYRLHPEESIYQNYGMDICGKKSYIHN